MARSQLFNLVASLAAGALLLPTPRSGPRCKETRGDKVTKFKTDNLRQRLEDWWIWFDGSAVWWFGVDFFGGNVYILAFSALVQFSFVMLLGGSEIERPFDFLLEWLWWFFVWCGSLHNFYQYLMHLIILHPFIHGLLLNWVACMVLTDVNNWLLIHVPTNSGKTFFNSSAKWARIAGIWSRFFSSSVSSLIWGNPAFAHLLSW